MGKRNNIKLGIFGKSNFLEWTKGFCTRIFTGENPDQSLLGKASFRLLYKHRILKLVSWSDIIFCEFLSPLARIVSHISSKPIFIRIHRGELDKPELFTGVNWRNVIAIIADSNAYRSFIQELVPKYVKVVKIPPGVEIRYWPFKISHSRKVCTWSIPIHRKRIYSLMLALAGHHTLYLAGYSAAERINALANNRFNLGHILEPKAKFPQWLWDKEFYVHHALDEGLSVAIQEAMASGLIPVVHNIPMATELVPEELTYVYDSELVEKLEYLKSLDEDERDSIKRKLRKKAETELASKIVHLKKKQLFEEWLTTQ